MRRSERSMSNAEINAFITEEKVCRIAMYADGQVYIVPLNFGHNFLDGQLNLFFHSAFDGRKIDMLKQNPVVCFEMDDGHALVEGQVPCSYSYSYLSIIGHGNVVFLESQEEKTAALSAIMAQQTGDKFSFSENEAKKVCVFKIVVTSIAGKKH